MNWIFPVRIGFHTVLECSRSLAGPKHSSVSFAHPDEPGMEKGIGELGELARVGARGGDPLRAGLDRLGWLLLILGLGSMANALWMLAGPMHWYQELPAAVPDTGPFNPHFVRDIGCAFLTVGVAQLWAAFAPRWRLPLVAMTALFLVAHAALHIFDTLVGNLPNDHWGLDLPGVYLPALVLTACAVALRRSEAGEHAT